MLVETPILFPGGDSTLAGVLIRNGSLANSRLPCVVVSGSWLTVKEQMPLLYARRLAELGYAAFIFDFAGFGQSSGEPRQAEIPERKIRDILAASDFVSTLSLCRPGGIGWVSVCASAQYALHAIARGANIAAFASIAGWYHNAETIADLYGGAEGVSRRLHFASQDVEALEQGKARRMAPAYAPGDERAGMNVELDYYASADRGAIRAWKNEMAPMSWAHWLCFDGLAPAASNSVPTLMVHGSGCALPDNARTVFERFSGPKRLLWLEGEQISFYDQPQQVGESIASIDQWLKAHLPAPMGSSDGDVEFSNKPRQRNDVREDITSAIGSLAVLIDARDWTRLLKLFADKVRVDYTSLFGGDVQHQTREQLIDGWRHLLSGFTATNHLIGTPTVTVHGHSAEVAASVTAWHTVQNAEVTEGNVWVVHGCYEMKLEQSQGVWSISALTLARAWSEGNTRLPRLALERADKRAA